MSSNNYGDRISLSQIEKESTLILKVRKARKLIKLDDVAPGTVVYAYNRVPGVFIVTVFPKNGTLPIVMKLDDTWIPICLTDYASAEVLKEAHELRQALGKGYIDLISREEAESILSTEEARIELERLRSKNSDITPVKEDESSLNPIQAMKSVDDKNVRIPVKDILSQTDLDDMKKMQSALALHMSYPLNKDELNFILTAATPKGPLYAWAEKVLSEQA